MSATTQPGASQPSALPSERLLHVGWFDCDANGHMRNISYIEHAIHHRFLVWNEHGFPAQGFEEHRIGPVVVREEIVYRRELRLLETFGIRSMCAGTNATGSRNLFVNQILAADGALAAELRSMVIWFDHVNRRARVPPPALAQAIAAMPKTEDYAAL